MNPNTEIKKYLIDHGITQTFLCRVTGIGVAKMNLALKGERRISLDEYALICGALGVNTDRFLKPRIPDSRKETEREAAVETA